MFYAVEDWMKLYALNLDTLEETAFDVSASIAAVHYDPARDTLFGLALDGPSICSISRTTGELTVLYSLDTSGFLYTCWAYDTATNTFYLAGKSELLVVSLDDQSFTKVVMLHMMIDMQYF
eukprot:TRINITY_DN17568_c0_g1_i1.p2 TRINITY_DN17568_c0_g1~~TRINITY_DN17568_c0_g1_i1.p2  ORF type:complete len:121 (+),score=35.96 TRINITY_DN17568_c0_g1_i1:503-865(+)